MKSEEQQAVLALRRVRRQLVKVRTTQINGRHGDAILFNLRLLAFAGHYLFLPRPVPEMDSTVPS